MEKFNEFALNRSEKESIKGAGQVTYTVTISGPTGTSITTVSFNDANNNGQWDSGESGYEWTVYRDSELPE
jgi:hypothetical protein